MDRLSQELEGAFREKMELENPHVDEEEFVPAMTYDEYCQKNQQKVSKKTLIHVDL